MSNGTIVEDDIAKTVTFGSRTHTDGNFTVTNLIATAIPGFDAFEVTFDLNNISGSSFDYQLLYAINLGSDGFEDEYTSDGDSVLEVSDSWYVNDDTRNFDPFIYFNWSRNTTPPSDFSKIGDNVRLRYDGSLGAGATRSFTFIIGLETSLADALFTADCLDASNVNNPPVLTMPLAPTFLENSSTNPIEETIQVSDTDGDSQSLTLTATNGIVTILETTGLTLSGNGSANVTFNGTLADVNDALDSLVFEPNSGFVGTANLQVLSYDGNCGFDDENFDITISDANPVITDDDTGTVDESVSSGVVVDLATTGDTNGLTWSITEGNTDNVFSINAAGEISVAGSLDFETTESYTLTVAVDDEDGDTDADDTEEITIGINNVNDVAPVITSNPSGIISISENSSAVTTVQATDADNLGSIIYSIDAGDDGAAFSIGASTGVLSFNSAPNFESPSDIGDGPLNNTYVVTVRASDGVYSDTQAITVTVTDVNTVIVDDDTGSVAEDVTSGVVVDLEVTGDTDGAMAWSILDGNTGGFFAIDNAGQISVVGNLDFESTSSYTLTVGVDDEDLDANIDDTEEITINITDVNDNSPMITSNGMGVTASVTLSENGDAVTTVEASDKDTVGSVTYSLAPSADSDDFSIDPTTGALSFAATPNFENPTDSDGDNVYVVRVVASDGVNPDDAQEITVTVEDVNEPPSVSLTIVTASLPEDTDTSSRVKVADVVVTDDALGDEILRLGGGGAGSFDLDGTELFLQAGIVLDFEAQKNFIVSVEVDDPEIGGVRDDVVLFTLPITDVNDNSPVFQSGNGEIEFFTVTEGLRDVGIVNATDVDTVGSAVSYYIDSEYGDGLSFTVNPFTGLLRFRTEPDYENPTDSDGNNVYTVRVIASDGRTPDDTLDVTVTVGNGNDNPPVIVSNGGLKLVSVTVSEGTDIVTTIEATDLDNDAITYSIRNRFDYDDFTINPVSGMILFASTPDFDNPTDNGGDNIYNIDVIASDGSPRDDVQKIVVTVLKGADETAPTAAFTSVPEGPTNSNTIRLAVTFSEEVLNFDVNDVVPDLSQFQGIVDSFYVDDLTDGDSETWNVVVTGVEGNGLIGLDFSSSADVVDRAANAVDLMPTIDDPVLVDQIEPLVTIDPLLTDDRTPQLTGYVSDPDATILVAVVPFDGFIGPEIKEGPPEIEVREDSVEKIDEGPFLPLLPPEYLLEMLAEPDIAAINNGPDWILPDDTLDRLPLGLYTVLVTATDPAGNVGTAVLPDGLYIVSDREMWERENFSEIELLDEEITAASADPDGDLIPNYVEYAFGLDPSVASEVGLPVITLVEDDGSRLQIEFPRCASKVGIVYEVEVSDDLVNWSVIARSQSGQQTENVDTGAKEVSETSDYDMTIVTVQDSVEVDAGKQRFMRIKVSEIEE